jgi:hypothetical protein
VFGELVPIPTLPLELIRIFSEKVADPVPNAKEVFVYIVEAAAIVPRNAVELLLSVHRMESASAEDATWNFVFTKLVPIPTFCDASIYIAFVEFVAKPSAFVAGKYMPFVGTEALPGTML